MRDDETKGSAAYVRRAPYRDHWLGNVTREQVLGSYSLQRGEFLFIWINKTAGLSVTRAMGIDKDRYNHFTATELCELVGESEFDRMYKFCFVRNPWDRVVSEFRFRKWTWQNNLTSDSNFSDWVRSAYVDKDPEFCDWPKMFMPQLEWLTDENGRIAVDFVGRFENLQKDFDRICDAVAMPAKRLGYENKSGARTDYRTFFDVETKAIVGDVFKADIEYFGYEF
jgi:hypothetical protein